MDGIFFIMALIALVEFIYSIFAQSRVEDAEAYAWYMRRMLLRAYNAMILDGKENTPLARDVHEALYGDGAMVKEEE